MCIGEYGFLREQRRTNVAVTRARRHLALVGDSSTISNEPFISGLLDHCSQCGEIRTAHEYFHGKKIVLHNEFIIHVSPGLPYSVPCLCTTQISCFSCVSMLNLDNIHYCRYIWENLFLCYTDICFESTPITSVSKHKKDAKIQSTPISHVIHGKEHRHTRKDQLDMAADAELRKK